MPKPYGRHESTPDELASEIARRLADSPPPPARRSAWRDSVLVGRLISAAALLTTIATLTAVTLVGISWLRDRPIETRVEVLASELERPDPTSTSEKTPEVFPIGAFLSLTPPTNDDSPFLVSGATSSTGITLPTPLTTSSAPHSMPGSPSSSSISPPSTSSSPTTTGANPPTTAPTQPTTTSSGATTLVTTTTTIPPTTTTLAGTTTTCGNRGRGRGNC